MAAGDIPVDKLRENDLCFAIADINPRAPVHFMVIPIEHIPTARDVDDRHGPLLARMVQTANQVADDQAISGSGYRLAFNCGDDAGMTIPHLHLHVLGGRRLGAEG
jgi:histidine triad (HIT) family protein